ncbi:MAG: RDD family protein [Pseudomonadota bacterium]
MRLFRKKPATAEARRAALEPERRLITDFVPPEGVPIRFEVAGMSSRIIAQITDILITFAALVLIMVLLLFSNAVPITALISIGALLYFGIRVPYYTLSELLMNGQTLGKRMSGLRVISVDGRTLSPHAVTVRNLLKELEVFVPGSMLLASASLDALGALILLVWIGILAAVPLSNRNRQRLGDILAGTYVVSLPKPVLLPDLAEAPPDQTDTRFTFEGHHLDHYGRYELQTLEALLHVDQRALNRAAGQRHSSNMRKVAQTIAKRIGYPVQIGEQDAAAFLLAFYRTQRAYLENRKLFGDAREDKFHRSQTREPGQDG